MAIKIQPENVNAHYGLGYTLHSLGFEDKALISFRKALNITHESADVHRALADIYGDRLQYARSLKHYREAIRLEPDNGDTHWNMSLVYEDVGRIQEARRAWKAVLKYSSNEELIERANAKLRKWEAT